MAYVVILLQTAEQYQQNDTASADAVIRASMLSTSSWRFMVLLNQ